MSSVWPGVRVRGTRFAGHYPWEKCPKIKSLFRYSSGRSLISRYMSSPGPTEEKLAFGFSLGKIIRARRIMSSAVKRAKRDERWNQRSSCPVVIRSRFVPRDRQIDRLMTRECLMSALEFPRFSQPLARVDPAFSASVNPTCRSGAAVPSNISQLMIKDAE
jgi:hypothetical protein